jgi:uncharacterized metal-binding protein YceD (DUF177 family)
MLFRLDELQQGKTVTRDVDLENAEVETDLGPVVFSDVHAHLKFRLDPLGYVVHYTARGKVTSPCVRCTNPVTHEVETEDWVSLRTRHPEEGHLVLDKAEMNVRFIDDTSFDVREFILEVIELEAPDFPRHEEGDPECMALVAVAETENAPFSALGKLLKQE